LISEIFNRLDLTSCLPSQQNDGMSESALTVHIL